MLQYSFDIADIAYIISNAHKFALYGNNCVHNINLLNSNEYLKIINNIINHFKFNHKTVVKSQ